MSTRSAASSQIQFVDSVAKHFFARIAVAPLKGSIHVHAPSFLQSRDGERNWAGGSVRHRNSPWYGVLGSCASARLYFCTEEPTWKLISLSVPPMNLPLIRLPFFSSKESAHARDAPSHSAMTNPQFSFNFTLASPLQRSCSLLQVHVDWDGWGSHDRTQLVLLGHLSSFLFGDQVGLLRQG